MDQSSLKTAVQKAVADNLPAATVEELKKFFDIHEDLKQKINALEYDLGESNTENEELSRELKKHNALDAREDNIKVEETRLFDREKAVSERERLLDVAELQIKLEAATHYGQQVESFMLNLSRNAVVKRTFAGDVLGHHEQHYGGNGESHLVSPISHKVENTTTTEEVVPGEETQE
jgi:hypothetical protein